jgi:hypothetical protein
VEQIVARRQRASDQLVVVGVDDAVLGVPDLDPRQVLGDRACLQLLVQRVHSRWSEAVAQIVGGEPRLDADARQQLCRLAGIVHGATDDLVL